MKVKPIKVKKVSMYDVPVGALFTLDGVRYLKLDQTYNGLSDKTMATTQVLFAK